MRTLSSEAAALKNTCIYRASLVAQLVKNLPAVQETLVQYLGKEDFLEKGMTTLSNIPAWRIPWTEQPGGLQSTRGLQSMGSQRGGHNSVIHSLSLIKAITLSVNDLSE